MYINVARHNEPTTSKILKTYTFLFVLRRSCISSTLTFTVDILRLRRQLYIRVPIIILLVVFTPVSQLF